MTRKLAATGESSGNSVGVNVMSSSIRRFCVDRLCPAEKAVHDAILVVESLGADPRLTKAVVLLDQAKTAVSDFVDGLSSLEPTPPKPTDPGEEP